MKRILIVNSVCGIRSTGRICADIAYRYEINGWKAKIAYGRIDVVPQDCIKYAIKIGGAFEMKIHAILTRIFDLHGTGICSYFATRRFLKWAEEFNPDVLWLHNIHGYYLNCEMLFKWIKLRPQMQVKWTLHSCWPFTGHCSHFTAVDCNKWKDGCYDCPQKNSYPSCLLFGNVERNYAKKKSMFTGVKDLTLITPCKWLADLTKMSFLREYPVEVCRNEVDLAEFKRISSDFRKRYGLEGKTIILGVSLPWTIRKGLNDFIRLRELLDDRYSIVLVGLTRKQREQMPSGVVGIERTNSKHELAEIYSAADWFFNPTQEDTFPTVNLEAVACGCRVATYDTGGSKETVEDVANAVVLSGKDKTPEGFARIVRSLD